MSVQKITEPNIDSSVATLYKEINNKFLELKNSTAIDLSSLKITDIIVRDVTELITVMRIRKLKQEKEEEIAKKMLNKINIKSLLNL